MKAAEKYYRKRYPNVKDLQYSCNLIIELMDSFNKEQLKIHGIINMKEETVEEVEIIKILEDYGLGLDAACAASDILESLNKINKKRYE